MQRTEKNRDYVQKTASLRTKYYKHLGREHSLSLCIPLTARVASDEWDIQKETTASHLQFFSQ